MAGKRKASIQSGILALLLGGIGYASLLSGIAGEPIKIIEGDSKVEVPTQAIPEDIFSRPFYLRNKEVDPGGASLAPVGPSPSSRSMMRNDQSNKNWLNGSDNQPEDRDAALKQIFGVKEYGQDATGKKSKGSFESALGQQESNDKQNDPTGRGKNDRDPLKRRDSLDDDEMDSLKRGSESRFDTTRFDPANDRFSKSQSSFMPNSGLPSIAPERSLNPFYNGSQINNSTSLRNQESSGDSFQKLLGGRQLSVDRILDPINSPLDGTRQEINPVVGRSISEFSGGSRFSDPLSGARTAPTAGPRYNALDSLGSRALGASSYSGSSPAAVAPSAPVFQPRPAVLDIPRRKF